MTEKEIKIQQYSIFVISLLVPLLGFAIQWGVLSTKLDNLQDKLVEMTTEVKFFRTQYLSLEKRVSYFEGLKKGQSK